MKFFFGGGGSGGGGGSRVGWGGVRVDVNKELKFLLKLKKKNFTIESSHCTLQADKSFEPLPIILSEILHLQNCRVQNSKKGNNSKSII